VEEPAPSGPFGANGMSESSLICIAPAIANAIHDAIGIPIKDMPITPEKIRKATEKQMRVKERYAV